MGESKIIVEDIEKSSSKSPRPSISGSATPSAGLSEVGTFTKKGGTGNASNLRIVIPNSMTLSTIF